MFEVSETHSGFSSLAPTPETALPRKPVGISGREWSGMEQSLALGPGDEKRMMLRAWWGDRNEQEGGSRAGEGQLRHPRVSAPWPWALMGSCCLCPYCAHAVPTPAEHGWGDHTRPLTRPLSPSAPAPHQFTCPQPFSPPGPYKFPFPRQCGLRIGSPLDI